MVSVRSIHQDIEFEIPSHWHILTLAEAGDTTPRAGPETLMRQALAAPIAARTLEDCLTPASTVAVIVEDLTRNSPKKKIVGCLLAELHRIGISAANISVIISLGTHRALSVQELENAFGKEIVTAYEFINHDCHSPDLVPIGRLSSGAIVKINRRVHQADFRIGIGSIFPHPMNGFGGGGKILFPGVANFEAIFEHHLNHSFRPGSALGVIDGNPFHAEVSRMALAGRLDFIINSVLDHDDQLYQVVCGDPVQAHIFGAGICRRIVTRRFAGQADVTIISAFPYSEGPQIMKPLAPAEIITRKGGTIILYADCRVPLPELYFEGCAAFRHAHSGSLRDAVLSHFSCGRRIIPGAPPELNMSMAQAMLALNDYQVILVTQDIPAVQIRRLGFSPAASMAAAIGMTDAAHNRPTVNIVPSGGIILPVPG
jgi:lactate racemase